MIQSVRNTFNDLRSVEPAHAGLWFGRYFPAQETKADKSEGKGKRAEFLKTVVGISEPRSYAGFFADQTDALECLQSNIYHVELFKVLVLGRVTTGLGNANPIENGFSLHHTYGVPFLTGSGLKGLAARCARERLGAKLDAWKEDGEFYRMVFGDTTESGGVEFFDALPVPRATPDAAKGGEWKLVADVLTPHHIEYQKDGSQPPADWDSPKPIPFLSAQGTFQIPLVGPADNAGEWVGIAKTILLKALEEEGFGAKTSSGFGRMKISP